MSLNFTGVNDDDLRNVKISQTDRESTKFKVYKGESRIHHDVLYSGTLL